MPNNMYSMVHSQQNRQTTGINQDITVSEWADMWLESYKSNVEYRTREMYELSLRVHIVPGIGHHILWQLRPMHIQAMINNMLKKGLTRSVKIAYMTTKQMLDSAVHNDIIDKNVALAVKLPKIPVKKKRSLSDDEIRSITNAKLSVKERAFLYVLLYTGLRRGEALALEWGDIDIEDMKLVVNKAQVIKKNRTELKTTKSAAGMRVIPMPKELVQALVTYRDDIAPVHPRSVLFPAAKTDVMMSASSFKKFWKGLKVRAALIEDVTPHIFRHTYATMLYKSGVDMKSAQYLLGHASIKLTMDIYTHLERLDQTGVLDKLDAYIQKLDISGILR